MCPMGPILNFYSLGFYYVPLVSIRVLILRSLGFLFYYSSGSVLSPIDIFKFLLRKREWVKLYIILATQLIKARAQQERYR